MSTSGKAPPQLSEKINYPLLVPESLWLWLHIEFAEPFKSQDYLILIDAYSKWPEVLTVKRTTSCESIIKLLQGFIRFGLSYTFVPDNGSTFTTAEFSIFSEQNDCQHIQFPLFLPQWNGQVERFVDTFKRAHLKLKREKTILKSYRATPNQNVPDSRSPAEALMNRKIRLLVVVSRPVQRHFLWKNTVMENQLDHKHGAVRHLFLHGQFDRTKDYSVRVEKWEQGDTICCIEHVTYDVDIQSSILVWHANQQHPLYLSVT